MGVSRVTAVIVTHNSPPVVRSAIQALLRQSVKLSRIVVVDCGSNDTSDIRTLPELSPIVSVRLETNRGFSGGNNVAIAEFKDCSDYFILVNPDAILSPTWIEGALEFMGNDASSDVGVLSSPLLGMDMKTLQPTGLWDSLGIYYRPLRGWQEQAQLRPVKELPCPRVPYEPDAICGAVMFFPSHLVDAVACSRGFFDETFFTYKEDIELSLRVRRAGYRLVLLPQLIAHHGRGWPKRRCDTPYWSRWRSARNDLTMTARYFPRDLLFFLAKYLYVVSIERVLIGMRRNWSVRRSGTLTR